MQNVATIGKFACLKKYWEGFSIDLIDKIISEKAYFFLSQDVLLDLGFSILATDLFCYTVLLPDKWRLVRDPVEEVIYFYNEENQLVAESYFSTLVKFLQ